MCEGGLRVISYFILFSPFDELLGHAPDDCFKKFPCMSRTVFVRPLVLIVLIDGRAREKGWTEVGESALPKSRPRSSSPCSIFFKMTEKISVQEIRKIKKRKQWSCQRSVRVQTETGRCPCVHCCGGSLMGLFVNYGSCSMH